MSPEPHRKALTAALVKLVLIAAVVTAPVFLFGEGFEPKYLWRVAASNGACVVLCLGMLALLKRDRIGLAAGTLIYGLLALVGALAWSNGEPVHVNVINFTLVAVLASVIGMRRDLVIVGVLSAAEMVGIAWKQPVASLPTGKELEEVRFESIVQFLPTFCVVIGVLWIGRRSKRVD